MIRNVYLQGDIGDRFGQKFSINSESCVDIFKCIEANRPNFKEYLKQCKDNNLDIEVKMHDKRIETEEGLRMPLKEGDVTITIIPSGSKSAGEKLGAAILIILSFFYPPVAQFLVVDGSLTLAGSMAAGMAANLAISGITQLLAPDPEGDGSPENYLYKGDAHIIDEGDPVPLLYGRLLIAGSPIAFNVTNGKHNNLQSTVEPDGAITRHYIGMG